MNSPITRRSALKKLAGTGAAAAAAASVFPGAITMGAPAPSSRKGNINHSVCRWCYGKIELEKLCEASRDMGIHSVELILPKDFATVQKFGLICAMSSGPGGIEEGFNRLENHDRLVKGFEEMIPQVATAGFPNIICFSGNRKGLSDEQGLENCAIGLKRVVPIAEKHKINVCMELLNSKVNHKDYQCDKTPWGVELCKRVGSERFKLLYDIYHMQIMEGDVIATIRQYKDYIAHYHTGGVPGRGEIDDSQELNYLAIMKAIVETGFKGHVAQEFVPKRPDALASLQQGVIICDV